MDFLGRLLTTDSVAHTVLIISLVGALGLAIGSIRIFGITLGIAGVLFAGLLFGHFKLSINEHVLEFVREFGLILFVYTIGMQVGPGFVASFKREGLRLNLLAGSVVITGAVLTVLIGFFAKIPIPAAVGMLSGATTNTPSLAAAQQALKDIPAVTQEISKMPALGYAVAYPFGVIGIILTMILVRNLFRIDPTVEAELHEKLAQDPEGALGTINLVVQNAHLEGTALYEVSSLKNPGIVVSRIFHANELAVARPDSILHLGDVILAVGPKKRLEELRIAVGEISSIDLRSVPSRIVAKRIVVTHKEVLGKTLAELELQAKYDVTVTRVSRADIEFAAQGDVRLQIADTLLLVGEEENIQKACALLGNSPKSLDHPQMIPIFIGLALGVILGSWPVTFPGMPAAVKLGLAGGPLLVAIFLSRARQLGPFIWYMPISANFMLREFGIILFLACVGLRSGDQFVATLLQGQGFYWMAWAAAITIIPILVVAFIARSLFKMNYMTLCGLLAGSMTDPPALAFANTVARSSAPSVSYSTVYPLVMILRVVCAQIIVLLFFR